MFFLKSAIEFHFSYPEIQNSLQKKPGKSPEEDLKNDEQLAITTRKPSIVSKPAQKKQN